MSYPEFTELILKALKEMVPSEIQIKSVTTEKNNSCVRQGILFKKQNVNYAPAIYLEPFYEAYKKGHTVEALAEEVYRCYLEDTHSIGEEVNDFLSFEKAQKHIFAKIVHIEENKHMLEQVPYREFLDFAIIPYFEVHNDHIYRGSVQITKNHMNIWNISEDALLDWAITHTKQCKETLFCPMTDMIKGLFDEKGAEFLEWNSLGLYILTNKQKYFGAVQVCFPEVLQEISTQIGTDFFLLPSSIHEWLILPEKRLFETDTLWETVQYVNKYGVQDEEILSGNIYFYSAISQKIHICSKRNIKND